jgi:hypothetical protein
LAAALGRIQARVTEQRLDTYLHNFSLAILI